MGWDSHGPGEPPPEGNHGQFGNAGHAQPSGDDETVILPARPAPQGNPHGDTNGGAPEDSTRAVPESDIWTPVGRDQWLTQRLPPGYAEREKPPRFLVEADKPSRNPFTNRPLVIAVSALLIVAVLAGGLVYALKQHSAATTQRGPACARNTPCQVVNDYLAAYAKGNYEAMYKLTSDASHTRFSNAAILRGNYTDAHDYIVNRTSALLKEARVYHTSVTAGPVRQTGTGKATSTAHIVMTSSRLGTITQDIPLPLVDEHNAWHVDWSPGLVFSQLDDPKNDPNYQRLLHLFTADGARGQIFDRDGNVLAKDETVYEVDVVPGQIKNETNLLTVLSASLDMTSDQIKAKYAGKPADQAVAIRTITPMLFTNVQGALNSVSGVQIQTPTARVYPYGADAAAVTGYVSIVTADDLKNDTSHYYEADDMVARSGVELWGDQYLRPVKGGKLDIVNTNADGSFGDVAATIAARAAVNGADIHTTIAIADQQAAMAAMRATPQFGSGAMAVDPTTGEVLTLASFPIYDPNDFSLGFTDNGWARFTALDHPYVNRALSSAEPIGSVFKVITLAAGLEHGVGAGEEFTCTGSYLVPGETQPRIDDKPGGHGTLTAPQALPPSCDVIFWQIAVKLNGQDPHILPNVAKDFGFGTSPGIVGLSDGVQSAGTVPDPEWLRKTHNAGWSATDAANLGIGQGFFQATPAQVALASAAIANGGKRMQPRLVTSVVDDSGATIQAFAPKQIGSLPVTADHLAVIEVAMLGSPNDPDGTSYATFHGFPIRVAGKTGTAESGQAHPHAWYMTFAPASPVSGPPVQAQVAAAALVEYSDAGATYAAPITKAIYKAAFHV